MWEKKYDVGGKRYFVPCDTRTFLHFVSTKTQNKILSKINMEIGKFQMNTGILHVYKMTKIYINVKIYKKQQYFIKYFVNYACDAGGFVIN